MTPHLSVDEQVSALDGELGAARAAHLDACDACRRDVEALRAVVSTVTAVDVPEPSPLFWDHFSARVRHATAAESQPRGAGWSGWSGWRAWAVLATAVVAVVTTLSVRHDPSAPLRPASASATVAGGQTAAGGYVAMDTVDTAVTVTPWDDVLQLASGLSVDDLRGFAPLGSEPSSLVDDLNPAERAAFVRLLHAEMEKIQ